MKNYLIFIVVVLGFCGACNSGSSEKQTDVGQRCRLTPDIGPCRALMERYFFNAESGKCQQFYWGGCNGTVPFESKAECVRTCE